jgi:dTDP-4-dehydrorhamnose reductase
MTRILVTGAGGFIGHHLVAELKRQGHWVRGVDIKRPEYGATAADEFLLLDLREPANARQAADGVEHVYALAADMGGMGYISSHHALILHNNSLINLNTLEAARAGGAKRYLYSSSACVYPEHRQTDAAVTALKEDDAYPAQPQDAYGWEKLITERLCTHYREDYGIETRIVRFHNIYGPYGTWDGGREKAPAAMCRKVATAKLTGQKEIEIWGDGEQTRIVLLHRRLPRRGGAVDGLRFRRSAESRVGPSRDDQSTRRHRLRRGGRDAGQAAHPRPARRARPQLGQQPPAPRARLGAASRARDRRGPDLQVDRGSGQAASRDADSALI